MKIIKWFVLSVCVCLLMAGCLSPTQTTVEELDLKTGKVLKRTVTSESVVKTVVDSTKDKWVLVSDQGWKGGLRAIPPASSAENPAGCLEIVAGKSDSIMSTMPMEKVTPEVAEAVIDKLTATVSAARAGGLEFNANGVSSSSSK